MFKKLRFKTEFLVSYLKQKYIYVLIGLLFGSSIFISRNYILSLYNSALFSTKTIGVEGLYTFSILPEEIVNQISFGLTVNTENDKPILSPLVKSYTVQNNNKDYIFDLNQNIFWQNGKKFTAYDVNYQIANIDFIPLSANQLKIHLDTDQEKNFSPILTAISKPLFKKNLIGLGQYKIKEITYQDGYVNTLKLKSLDTQKPNIYYHFYSNEKDLISAYKLGNVDEIEISSLPTEFNDWTKTKITQKIKTGQKYSAVFLNTQKLNNKQLRQALAYATPKTNDKNDRCLGPISPGSWAYNTTIKEYNYNPTRAQELFDKNKITKINLSVNDRRLLSKAEEIKNAWQNDLHIETIITFESQVNQDYDALLTYAGMPHDPDQYLFWHSTQTKTNLTKLNNPRIDKLLEEGRQTTDFQERKQIYQDFQRYLLEESPAIFLSYPTTYTISRVK
ncbi:MAG: ABC transporter substrate-binding protein [Candidatus Shapirobacteria bacterium]|nr:ABC transporter substrate-binding protein [Candidatus Shapirobacteria bacterium]